MSFAEELQRTGFTVAKLVRIERHQKIWRTGLVVASCLYLILELIFNANLVDVAGATVVGETEIRRVEIFGRALSGIGVTLLIASFVLKNVTFTRGIILTLLMGALIWPLVFYGQKLAVEVLLVMKSTPEQRQQAFASQLARGALANESLHIEGLEYPADEGSSARRKSFLAVFGALVYLDDKLIDTLKLEQSSIAEAYLRQAAYGEFDEQYGLYAASRETVRRRYKDYQDGEREYQTQRKQAQVKVDDKVQAVLDGIDGRWGVYRAAVQAHEKLVADLAQGFAPDVASTLQRLTGNQCTSDRCLRGALADYNNVLARRGLSSIPIEYWLTTRASKPGWKGVFGGGSQTEYVVSDEVSHYREKLRLLPAITQKFEQRSGGIPVNITNEREFRRHPSVSKAVRADLASSGIIMPKSWTILDRGALTSAVAKQVDRSVAANRKKQSGIAPGLTWDQFQRSAAVQSQFKKALGQWYVKPTLADWNNEDFNRYIVEPGIRTERDRLLARIQANVSEFADDGRLKDIGRDAVRAIWVPAMGMAISLILSIITAQRLLVMAILARKKDMASKKRLIQSGIIAFIVVIPLLVGTVTAAVSNKSGINYFVSSLSENSHPVAGAALTWTLTLQPVIKPVGDALSAVTRIYHVSAPLIDDLPNDWVWH
jgi:hypothetical protein